MMEIELIPYADEREAAAALIQQFWQAHNGGEPSLTDAYADLDAWTRDGHRLYFIVRGGLRVGFVHLGSRGCAIDWLEDIFVQPSWQGRGMGTQAIRLAEEIVRTYSDCLYIEAAARNERAIRLYRRIGYDCLNTITIRKDFRPESGKTVGRTTIAGCDFVIKKR